MHNKLMISAIILLAWFTLLAFVLLIAVLCKCCIRTKEVPEETKSLGDDSLLKVELLDKLNMVENGLQKTLDIVLKKVVESNDLLGKFNTKEKIVEQLKKERDLLLESNKKLVQRNEDLEHAIDDMKLEFAVKPVQSKDKHVYSKTTFMAWCFDLLKNADSVLEDTQKNPNFSNEARNVIAQSVLMMKNAVLNCLDNISPYTQTMVTDIEQFGVNNNKNVV